MIDAKHIAALEAWLKKTRDDQNQLIVRLRDTENEADQLRSQIKALDEIAQQAESMIDNLIVSLRPGGRGGSKVSATSDEAIPQPEISPETFIKEQSPMPPREVRHPAASGTIAYFNRPQIVRSNRMEPISHRFADRTITQACTLLLKEAGIPLHVNDLYNLLVAGGMEFKGNNPTISVAVSLNRNRRFRKVGPGTFDLMMREASQAAS
ncbi:MAG: hypothetical protein HOP17_17805 [Acidobacteria bacterium]|nr:hypothetical protein [Acidobacteriota bacterium]